jgi:hypothetical protein
VVGAMMEEQKVPALLAALLGEGVSSDQIYNAVERVRRCELGTDIASMADRSEPQLVRAFIFEQSDRLR